ncbi:MAG TPA: transcriptional regulator NrdR [Flavobacterium sp.]|nr:transcriptional regulator NrdR [Flavobacterium sp.]
MQCPRCKHPDSKVVESRPTQESQAIRRRRECLDCGFRYSTYEQVEILELYVMKRSGGREPYSFEKLQSGIIKAFEKRDISEKELKRFTEDIEREIQKRSKNSEIESSTIGSIIIKKLKRKDPVAYMRFASVYLQFQDIEDFQQALSSFGGPKVLTKKNIQPASIN